MMSLYPEEQQSSLLECINRAVAHARKAPFYAQRLNHLPDRVGTLEEFGFWPLTTPEEVLDVPPVDRCAVPLSQVERILASSGGPATAKYFPYTLDDVKCNAIEEDFLALNVPREGFLLNLMPESWGGGTLLAQMARRAGMSVVSPPLQLLPQFLPALLSRMQFTALLSLPSKLPDFCALLEQLGKAPGHLGIELTMVGGEVMSDWLVGYIEERIGARVINLYGTVDTGGLGNGPGNDIQLYRAHYFEIVDGGLVVTNLEREAAPLIRYAIGDDVTLIEAGAKPVIQVRGRRVDRLCSTPDSVYALDVEKALFSCLGRPAVYRVAVTHDRYVLEVEEADPAAIEDCRESLSPRLDRGIEVRSMDKVAIEPSPGKLRRLVRSE